MKRTTTWLGLPVVAMMVSGWLAMALAVPTYAQDEAAPEVATVEDGLPEGVVDVGPKTIQWRETFDESFVLATALKADEATIKTAQAMVKADPAIKGFRLEAKDRLLLVALPKSTVTKAKLEYASDCSTNTQTTLTDVADIRLSAEAAHVEMTRLRHPKIPHNWHAVVTVVGKTEAGIRLDVTLKETAKTPAPNTVSLR